MLQLVAGRKPGISELRSPSTGQAEACPTKSALRNECRAEVTDQLCHRRLSDCITCDCEHGRALLALVIVTPDTIRPQDAILPHRREVKVRSGPCRVREVRMNTPK